MQGNLNIERLPRVLQELGRGQQTGTLEVSKDDINKAIHFGKGAMVFARSSVHDDRLGELLVRNGALSRSHLALASNKMRARKQRLGSTLVSLGLLSSHQVQAGLEEQMRRIICSLFTWDEGAFRFQEEARPVVSDMPVDLPTVPIILEGTRKMTPWTVERELGDLSRVASCTKDPRVIAHYANLTPEEGFVLSRVDGTLTLSDIVSVSPLTELDTLRSLYGLLSSGFLDVGAKSREVAPSERNKTPMAPMPPPAAKRASKPTATAKPTASAPSATQQTSRPEETSWIREEIEAKYRSLSSGTYYDWLEIRKTEDLKEIKRAFARLIKKYHPDRHQSPDLAPLRKQLEAIVTKVTQAHEALGQQVTKRRYDNSLRTEAPKGEVVRPVEPPKPEQPRAPDPGKIRAERYFKEAKKYYQSRDFHETVKLLEEAVELDGDNVRYHCLLAKALSHNPKWRKNAESHFKAALAIDPFDTECLVGLAELYEAVGLSRRAQALYAEAVEIDPGNAIWRMKLNALS